VEDLFNLYQNNKKLIRKKLNLKPYEIAVVVVGRFIFDKGHDVILNSIKNLNHLPIKLFFIGDHNTKWGRHIKNLVTELKLSSRVFFLGHRDDVRMLLSAMDILIQPSRREALGLSVLEALSAGIPVLASKVGGLPEIIKNGINGYLFDNENNNSLSALIEMLAKDPILRKKLSKGARKTYLSKFSVDRMIDGIIDVYNEILLNN
jgi:glycosyltransferase involved in cell wall biosynthesis